MLGKVLKLFFEDTLWSEEIDYFLVDLPPGTGDVMMDLKNFSEDAKMVIVTTPQESATNKHIKNRYGKCSSNSNKSRICSQRFSARRNRSNRKHVLL